MFLLKIDFEFEMLNNKHFPINFIFIFQLSEQV